MTANFKTINHVSISNSEAQKYNLLLMQYEDISFACNITVEMNIHIQIKLNIHSYI